MEHVSHHDELTAKDPVVVVTTGPVFTVDRTKLPTVTDLLGDEWTVWKGPKEGEGLEGEEDQDARATAVNAFDFSRMKFVHGFKDGEDSIDGEQKLERLKVLPDVRPDFAFGIGLFLEQGQTTLRWLYDNHGITWFEIPGTVMCHDGGYRYFLILSREGSGAWHWDYRWLKHERRRGWLAPMFSL
ncbi:MAG: hypothetical protein WCK46_00240 [Candidatus Adlerbacteria bacterium]